MRLILLARLYFDDASKKQKREDEDSEPKERIDQEIRNRKKNEAQRGRQMQRGGANGGTSQVWLKSAGTAYEKCRGELEWGHRGKWHSSSEQLESGSN